jgi:hypothetical protein
LEPLELRVLAKALRAYGQGDNPDAQLARELQERLLLERAKQGRQLVLEWEKAEDNILGAKDC